MSEYKVMPLDKLQPFLMRQLRPNILAQLKERISQGYNPARPITVVSKNGKYIVADGNHRLSVLSELKAKEVPVVVREGDPYTLAIQCNQDEDTYAPLDLFDWLDVVKQLKAEGLTQEKIGERIGWSREKVAYHQAISDKIVTPILKLAMTYQEGRVTEDCNTCHNFTEGWFRNSGVRLLRGRGQLQKRIRRRDNPAAKTFKNEAKT